MTVIDDFIFFYLPKTASSYIKTNLKRLVKEKNRNYLLRLLNLGKPYYLKEYLFPSPWEMNVNRNNQHGSVSIAIQNGIFKNKHKAIFTIRNPYFWYQSQMAYNYTERKFNINHASFIEITNKYSDFPNFKSLNDFVVFLNDYPLQEAFNSQNVKFRDDLGIMSVMYIILYSLNPVKVLSEINKVNYKNYLSLDYFPKHYILRNEHVDSDLKKIFTGLKESTKLFESIFNNTKINVSEKSDQNKIDEDSIQLINNKEWLIFKIHSEYLNNL